MESKKISLIQDKVFVHLTYSPRAETLKKKFQQLPLKYMRTKVDDISEFKVLERAVKKFKYNLVSDELEVPQIKYVDQQQQQRSQYLAEIDAVPSTSSEVGSLDVEQNNVLDLEDGEEEEMIKEFLSNVNKNDE